MAAVLMSFYSWLNSAPFSHNSLPGRYLSGLFVSLEIMLLLDNANISIEIPFPMRRLKKEGEDDNCFQSEQSMVTLKVSEGLLNNSVPQPSSLKVGHVHSRATLYHSSVIKPAATAISPSS